MDNIFEYPIDTSYILRKKNALIKTMRKNSQLRNIRIAVLGGSSTQDIVKLLDLFLLSIGYKAEFYESDFNRYYETIMYSKEVFEFKPDIIYIHTNIRNLKWKPDLGSKEVEIQSGVKSELALLTKMVTKIKSELKSTIIVNNIEYPQVRPLGNYDGVYRAGIIRYIRAMNSAIAEYVDAESDLLLLDINYIL
jgi:predicted enzyme involved in methoxymalonyl-ACP biosynthesis